MKTDFDDTENEALSIARVSVSVTDLRIGNYYSYDDDAIKLDGSLLATYLQNDCDLYLYPIVLTEQWLLKFGFVKSKDSEGYLLNGLVFYDGFLSSNQKEKLKSVHQLQNLYYALIGSELQIGNLTEH